MTTEAREIEESERKARVEYLVNTAGWQKDLQPFLIKELRSARVKMRNAKWQKTFNEAGMAALEGLTEERVILGIMGKIAGWLGQVRQGEEYEPDGTNRAG